MTFSQRDLDTDRKLAALSSSLPFLLLITPTNVNECRQRFLEGDRRDPQFEYRPLPDLAEYRHALEGIEPDSADDPVLRHFYTGLTRDLSLRIDMLAERGTDNFREAGIELFGHIERPLLENAEEILGAPIPPSDGEGTLAGGELVRHFAAELDHYRQMLPTITSSVELRPDTSGLVVSNGNLLIGAGTVLTASYVHTVAHHEVGVHILTHVNGHAQPLHVLGSGLARYDELQEALGLVAEFLAGGLRPSRVRLIAGRVIAAAHLREDETFAASFDRLVDAALPPKSAFLTAMRARRGGGLTKDAIYLRGLVRLLDYFRAGGEIEPLFLGKVSLEDLPLIDDLRRRGLLVAPPLRPRFLDLPDADERLQELREGRTPAQLGGLTA